MIPSAASQYNAAVSMEVAGMGDKDSAGEPGMSDQLHVQQEWEQVLAGGMAGMSQLASLYSELQQAPQKVDAPSCHQVDASSSNQLPSQQPADWEWATGPAQRLDPVASQASVYREHRQAAPVRVVESPVVDEAGQSAMQAALLCQILQHSQLQAQQHQQEQRLQRARQAAGQAEVPGSSVQQPASTSSLPEDLDQRAGAWRVPSQGAGSSGHDPGPGRAAGHGSGDPRQHVSAEPGSAGSEYLHSLRPSSDRGAAAVPQFSSAAAPPRPSRASRTQSSLNGLKPARHAEMAPAHIMATAAPSRRPSEARRLPMQPSMPDVPAQDLNSHAKQIQPCHCKKSMCLKLYCDCFASGHYCGDTCVCHNCHNTQDQKDLVTQTIAYTRSRNPASFEAKRALARGEHIKGCNCKNSRCLKKYCECFLAKKRCSDMCRCIGCANQAPDAAEPDQPNKAARVAPATPVGLPPQQAAASSRGRFPVPEAMQLRFGSKIRQAPEPLPVRPTHDGQAERPLPPGAYVMAPRRYSWEPRQRVAAPPPHAQSPISVPPARPPISAPAQRFPLPEAFALNLSDKAAEDAMQSGHDPSLAQPPQRYPVMDAHVLKPSGQPKEAMDSAVERRCSADGTSASEAGTVFGRSTTPSPSQEHVPARLGTSCSVTDDALSPNTLNRATFPAARFPALPEQAPVTEPLATAAAPPAGSVAGDTDAAQQPKAAVASSPVPIVLSDISGCNAEADLPALPNLGPFLTSLRNPLTIADAHVTLSLVSKGGDHISESPLSCKHISAVPFPSSTLQKTVSDPFNEGEAAEWLLRLG